MKKIICIIILLTSIAPFAFLHSGETEKIKYYSWIDRTRIRNKPDLKYKAIGHLAENEVVEYLGETGGKNTPLTLRKQYFFSRFWKIKTKSGLVGWVYAGALKRVPGQKSNFDSIGIKASKNFYGDAFKFLFELAGSESNKKGILIPVFVDCYHIDKSRITKQQISGYEKQFATSFVMFAFALSAYSGYTFDFHKNEPGEYMVQFIWRNGTNNADTLNKMFTKFIGEKLIIKTIRSRSSEKEWGINHYCFYNKSALLKAFKKLYVKPSFRINEYTMLQIYNTVFKDYIRLVVKHLQMTRSSRIIFNKYCKMYESNLKSETIFDGLNLANKAYFAILKDGDNKTRYKLNQNYDDVKVIGFLIRRKMDGTLPVLLDIFKQILKDYDYSTYQKVKDLSL